ncbi:MAG: glycerophosphodiester phosphodiesterase family protein [Pseudomonadota bacterium]
MSGLDWLVATPIAHRALHDLSAGRAENSWGAFEAAINAGYAIECDVQVSKTGEAVVFHDPVLGRMTGVDGLVREHTPAELSKLRLAETEDGIFTLQQHMDQVAGRVPVVVELKGVEGEDAGLVENVAQVLSAYAGPCAVMSFDHHLCGQFSALMPRIPRGLTAQGGVDAAADHEKAMAEFDLQFVSYSIHEIDLPFPQSIRAKGVPLVSWTVRSEEQGDRSLNHGAQMTFEGFLPALERRS